MPSSNSPCAACKIQRRKCTQECVFAPYFPPDNPQRFAYVHKVFGASNVAKLLNELSAAQREDAVKSLAYEAEARLRDPVYGCVGLISVLQHKLKHLQTELNLAKKELASYIGPQAMLPILQPPPLPHGSGAALITQHHQPPRNNPSAFSVLPFNPPMVGVPAHGGSQLELAAAAMAASEQQEELLRFNDGGGFGGASASQSGFNHHVSAASVISPSLALGPADDHSYGQNQPQQAELHHHHPLHQQLQAHLMLSPPTTLQPQAQQSLLQSQKRPKSESEKGRSTAPSC